MTFSIDSFTAECLEARREGESAVAVKELLARTMADPASLESALGEPSTMPSISTWFNSDELTVLHLVWPPAIDLFPHDHKMWAAIGLYGGREDNTLFRRLPDGGIERRGDKVLLAGDTVLLGDDTVHAVANPSRDWTASIHIYGGDFFADGRSMWPDPDGGAEPFDSAHLIEALDTAAEGARKDEAGVHRSR